MDQQHLRIKLYEEYTKAWAGHFVIYPAPLVRQYFDSLYRIDTMLEREWLNQIYS